MRINDPNTANVGASGLTQARETERAEQQQGKRDVARTGVEAGTDAVELSTLAQTVQAHDPASPQRKARLEALSSEVALGKYKVDSEAVADSLIQEGQVSPGGK